MPPTGRKSYDAAFKLKVIAAAQATNNCAAARQFGVHEKNVREWRKSEETLKRMPKGKRALRGGSPAWPQLEDAVADWVVTRRQTGHPMTRNEIKRQALQWAARNPGLCHGFIASSGWCSRFMERKGLVLRQKTRIAQTLPRDLGHKALEFQRHVTELRNQHGFSLSSMGNMDETPVWFDMPSNRTVDHKGARSVTIKTSGHEKNRFTVVLSCLADGTKLKPMVIFRRKRRPREEFPPAVLVHFHENGWMDEDGLKLWIDNVWKRRPGHANERSLLVWDSFRSHVSQKTLSYLRECKVETAVIPGGLTSVLQPLDVSLNKPFKDHIREEWTTWMANGQHSFTAGGYMRAATFAELCHFVINAWNKIGAETVKKSFTKCLISNALDATEGGDSDESEFGGPESGTDSAIEELVEVDEEADQAHQRPSTSRAFP